MLTRAFAFHLALLRISRLVRGLGPVTFVTLATIVTLVAPACSSSNTPAGPPPCDESKCLPGNKCLALGGEVRCRRVCTSNVDPASSCPFGFTCVGSETGGDAFCLQDITLNDDGSPVTKSAKGQWGAPCNPLGKLVNPDCDTAQGFYCHGDSPTDASAYCTRFDCETDRNCGAGFWCATLNTTPNVSQSKRGRFADRTASGIGEVHNVCVRREYCSSCKVDLDCPTIGGREQLCVDAQDGSRFCTLPCQENGNCARDAQCVELDGRKFCYPRAGTCVGDGSLCSPCRSDADCGDDGACIHGGFTTERHCAKKSTSKCSPGKRGSCPAKVTVGGAEVLVECTSARDWTPPDYCVGIYEAGHTCGEKQDQLCDYDQGCWTPNR